MGKRMASKQLTRDELDEDSGNEFKEEIGKNADLDDQEQISKRRLVKIKRRSTDKEDGNPDDKPASGGFSFKLGSTKLEEDSGKKEEGKKEDTKSLFGNFTSANAKPATSLFGNTNGSGGGLFGNNK